MSLDSHPENPQRARAKPRMPDPRTAMRLLIAQARAALSQVEQPIPACDGDCGNCLLKQIETFESELAGWEDRLERGETPRLGDLRILSRFGSEILASLARRGQ